jgi:hypothetical protein
LKGEAAEKVVVCLHPGCTDHMLVVDSGIHPDYTKEEQVLGVDSGIHPDYTEEEQVLV